MSLSNDVKNMKKSNYAMAAAVFLLALAVVGAQFMGSAQNKADQGENPEPEPNSEFTYLAWDNGNQLDLEYPDEMETAVMYSSDLKSADAENADSSEQIPENYHDYTAAASDVDRSLVNDDLYFESTSGLFPAAMKIPSGEYKIAFYDQDGEYHNLYTEYTVPEEVKKFHVQEGHSKDVVISRDLTEVGFLDSTRTKVYTEDTQLTLDGADFSGASDASKVEENQVVTAVSTFKVENGTELFGSISQDSINTSVVDRVHVTVESRDGTEVMDVDADDIASELGNFVEENMDENPVKEDSKLTAEVKLELADGYTVTSGRTLFGYTVSDLEGQDSQSVQIIG